MKCAMCGNKSYWRVSFHVALYTKHTRKTKTFYCNQCYRFFNPEGKRIMTGIMKDLKYFYGDELQVKTGVDSDTMERIENTMLVVKFRKII